MDSALRRFEESWRRGGRPALEQFLPGKPGEHPTILIELIHLDLHYRLKSGEAVRVEDYLQRYPELAQDQSRVVELIQAEFELRRQQDATVEPQEYEGRFPQYRSVLSLPTQTDTPTVSLGSPPAGTPSTRREKGPEQKDDQPTLDVRPTGGAAQPRLPNVPGYQILDRLGQGGMGVVYKARHTTLQRLVALKTILAGSHADQQELDRFSSEARAVAHLQHPNIVQIHEVGSHEGFPYFSLEFCPGGSLDRKLSSTPLRPDEASQLVEVLARAMHVAHEQGVIHRDLKPANVLLAPCASAANAPPALPAGAVRLTLGGYRMTAIPKITDFGLARRLDEPGQTQSGTILGTPSYMAPEQARGLTREVGPAADVYALGAILYETLTGRPPFRAPTALDTLRQVLQDDPVPPRRLQPNTPRDLETICLKCLQKEPAKRYETAEDLGDDLRRFQAGEAIHARPVGGVERAIKWARRRPLIATLLATVVLVTVVGAASFAWAFGQALEARNDAITQKNHALTASEEAKRDRKRALDALDETERARKQAEREKNLKLHELLRTERLRYFTLFQEAYGLYRNNDPVASKRTLDECRWDLRGPEFAYLSRLLDSNGQTLWSRLGPVQAVALSRDSKRLVSVSVNSADPQGSYTALVWDLSTGQVIRSVPGLKQVTSAALAADGNTLYLTDLKGTLRVLDLKSGMEASPPKFIAQAPLTFRDDGLQLCSAEKNGILNVWNSESGKLAHSIPWEKGAASRLALSGDGNRLCAAGPKGLKVWDLTRPREILVLPPLKGAISRLKLTQDGKRLFTIGDEHDPDHSSFFATVIRAWDVESGKELIHLRRLAPGVLDLAVSSDGKRLFAGTLEGSIKVWELEAADSLALRGDPVAVSPDGKRLFLWQPPPPEDGNDDLGLIKVWDLVARKELPALRGHPGRVTALATSGDGKWLCSASEPSPESDDQPRVAILKVWDLTTRKDTHTYRVPGEGVSTLAVSEDGNLLVAGSGDGSLRVWDLNAGKDPRKLGGQAGRVRSLILSSDSKRLLAEHEGGADREGNPRKGALTVWNLDTGKALLTFVDREDTPAEKVFAMSRDGKRLVFWDSGEPSDPQGGDPGKPPVPEGLKVWDVDSGKVILTLPGHAYQTISSPITSLTLSPDGRWLYSGSADKTIKAWDLEVGKDTFTLRGHTGRVTSLVIGRDGKRLFSAAGQDEADYKDDTIRVWDLEARKELLSLKGSPGAATRLLLCRNGTRLCSHTQEEPGAIKVWDLEQVNDYPLLLPSLNAVVAASRDGTRLITGSACPELTGIIDTGEGMPGLGMGMAGTGEGAPSTEQSSPISVWDLNTGKEILTLSGHKGWLNCLALSKDGRRLCTGGGDGLVKVWDLNGDLPPLVIPGFGGVALRMALSDDGRWLCFGGAITASGNKLKVDSTIKVWDLAAQKEVLTLRGSSAGIVSLALSGDGKHLAASGVDGTVRVWSVESGQETRSLTPVQGVITCLLLNGDGKFLVTGEGMGRHGVGSGHGTIKVFDLETSRAVLTLPGHPSGLASLSLSEDGGRLLSMGAVGGFKVWDLKTGKELLSREDSILAVDGAFEVLVGVGHSARGPTLKVQRQSR